MSGGFGPRWAQILPFPLPVTQLRSQRGARSLPALAHLSVGTPTAPSHTPACVCERHLVPRLS